MQKEVYAKKYIEMVVQKKKYSWHHEKAFQ